MHLPLNPAVFGKCKCLWAGPNHSLLGTYVFGRPLMADSLACYIDKHTNWTKFSMLDGCSTYRQRVHIDDHEVQRHGERHGSNQPQIAPWRHTQQRLILGQAAKTCTNVCYNQQKNKKYIELLCDVWIWSRSVLTC